MPPLDFQYNRDQTFFFLAKKLSWLQDTEALMSYEPEMEELKVRVQFNLSAEDSDLRKAEQRIRAGIETEQERMGKVDALLERVRELKASGAKR